MVALLLPWQGAARGRDGSGCGLVCVAQQFGDYVGGPFAGAFGEALEPFGILPLDTYEDPQLAAGFARVGFDVARIELFKVAVEVARPGIGVCPGIATHLLWTILRSGGVESQPVTISQLVGSTVFSITKVT